MLNLNLPDPYGNDLRPCGAPPTRNVVSCGVWKLTLFYASRGDATLLTGGVSSTRMCALIYHYHHTALTLSVVLLRLRVFDTPHLSTINYMNNYMAIRVHSLVAIRV